MTDNLPSVRRAGTFRRFWESLAINDFGVYRAYDKNDTLLYVGITTSLRSRIEQHFRDSVWAEQTHRLEFDHGYSEAEARAREAELIVRSRPLHNATLNAAFRNGEGREKVGAEGRRRIVRAVLRGEESQAEMARRHGLTKGHVSRLVSAARDDPERNLARAREAAEEARREAGFREEVLGIVRAEEEGPM